MCNHSHSELRTRSNDTSDASLEKRSEALFFRDGDQGIDEALVVGHTGTSLRLQSRLDAVGRGSQVSGGHTSDSSGSLEDRNAY